MRICIKCTPSLKFFNISFFLNTQHIYSLFQKHFSAYTQGVSQNSKQPLHTYTPPPPPPLHIKEFSIFFVGCLVVSLFMHVFYITLLLLHNYDAIIITAAANDVIKCDISYRETKRKKKKELIIIILFIVVVLLLLFSV